MLDEKQCSVSEFVNELDAPTGVDDICDIHYEYHQAYMLNASNISIQPIDKTSELKLHKESYKFLANLDLIIPPIA